MGFEELDAVLYQARRFRVEVVRRFLSQAGVGLRKALFAKADRLSETGPGKSGTPATG